MLLCIVFGKRRNIYVFWDIVLISIISFIYCSSLHVWMSVAGLVFAHLF